MYLDRRRESVRLYYGYRTRMALALEQRGTETVVVCRLPVSDLPLAGRRMFASESGRMIVWSSFCICLVSV